MESIVEMLSVLSVFSSFGSLVSIAIYVLQALGLYTLAQRRGIQHAWLAWIPVGSMWILGSIADDYQLKAKGLVKNRRKLLMVLTAVVVVLAIIVCVAMLGSVFEMIRDLERLERRSGSYTMHEYDSRLEDIMSDFALSFLPMLLLALVLSVVSIVAVVFQYICLYDLYASCDPNNKTLFLVLSIFVSVLPAIFIFVCRDKDQGMVPPAPYGYQPYQSWQQPQYQQSYQSYQQPQYRQPQDQPPAQQGPENWQ